MNNLWYDTNYHKQEQDGKLTLTKQKKSLVFRLRSIINISDAAKHMLLLNPTKVDLSREQKFNMWIVEYVFKYNYVLERQIQRWLYDLSNLSKYDREDVIEQALPTRSKDTSRMFQDASGKQYINLYYKASNDTQLHHRLLFNLGKMEFNIEFPYSKGKRDFSIKWYDTFDQVPPINAYEKNFYGQQFDVNTLSTILGRHMPDLTVNQIQLEIQDMMCGVIKEEILEALFSGSIYIWELKQSDDKAYLLRQKQIDLMWETVGVLLYLEIAYKCRNEDYARRVEKAQTGSFSPTSYKEVGNRNR